MEEAQDSATPTPAGGRHDEFRALLVADRERTSEAITLLKRDLASIAEDLRLTVADDEHDPEGATSSVAHAQTSALLATATRHLSDVDTALERIAEGTYGRCAECMKPISGARLEARPAASTCINCAASTQ